MTCNEGSISMFLYYTPLLYRKTWKEGVSSTSHVGSAAEAENANVEGAVHSDDPPEIHSVTPVQAANAHQAHLCAFRTCVLCGADLPLERHPKARCERIYCSEACRARAWRRRMLAREESCRSADNPSASREAIGGGS